MTEPTPDLVRAFWAHMTDHFSSHVVPKSNAVEMRLVSGTLSTLGILDAKTFLTKYATTIGHSIYLPFEPGIATNDWPLWSQISVCVHEHQHVVQYDLLGALAYGYRYLTSPSQRARFEAEAYRSNLEMDWWRYGKLADPTELASRLRAYGASEVDVAMARAILSASGESVRHGAVINPSTFAAIVWLNEHAPTLRTAAKVA